MFEKLAPIAQLLDEFPIAVDVGLKVSELLPHTRDALGLGVARVELAHFGIEQVVEEERQRSGGFPSPVFEPKAAGMPPLRFSASSRDTSVQPTCPP